MTTRVAATLSVLALLMSSACGSRDGASPASVAAGPTATLASDTTGQIAFMRGDPSEGVLAGEGVTYTVNADGSNLQQLFSAGPSAGPLWSPDGAEIHIFCCGDGMAAHFVDPQTGELRTLPPPDPTLEAYCGGAWSPDGERLTCEAFGVDDPSRNGIYTIRASDGGGISRITSNPGGEDIPGDYAPDGDRLVFVRSTEDGEVGVFVTDVDGGHSREISPPDVMVDEIFGGSWSPTGDTILFVARESEDHHKAIWIVHADGSSPTQLSITDGCGGPLADPASFGCYWPDWSPDGTRIVFTRSAPDGSQENLWVVNADGGGLTQLTDGGTDDQADWGPAPPG